MQYLVSCTLRGNELCIPSTQNNDRFLSHPTQFQRHVKARQLELWPFWMPGLPSTAHQIHSKSEMSYVSEGISGIEYCCQYRPRPHHKRTCCGVPKSRMWLEGQICKGTSAPKTLPQAACEMFKRRMRIPRDYRKNAAARKILQQEGDPLQRLWWSDSVGFVAGARAIPMHKRHKTVSLRLRGNISQVTMLLILVTGRLSKEKWTAFSRTRAK